MENSHESSAPAWQLAGKLADFPLGEGRALTIAGEEIAFFRDNETLYAISAECPHAGASLAEGEFVDGEVICPLHAWSFDVRDGQCTTHDSEPATTFPVRVENDSVFVRVQPATTYLVRYAKPGWVAAFRDTSSETRTRGERVLLQTDRGTEVGEVLATVSDPANKPIGAVIGSAVNGTSQPAEIAEFVANAESVLEERVPEMIIADAELLHDRKTLVLYFLGEASPSLGRLSVELAAKETFRVQFQSLLDEPAASGGCGNCGCGS